MKLHFKKPSWWLLIPIFLLALFAAAISLIWRLDRNLQTRIADGWFLPPIEFFAAPETLLVDQTLSPKQLVDQLTSWGWRLRKAGQPLHEGDFTWQTGPDCRDALPNADWLEEYDECLGVWSPRTPQAEWIALAEKKVKAIYLSNGAVTDHFSLPPERFAQFYDGKPILRTVVDLGEVPLECSQAVTAIEDADFLEHRGISPSGILRAMARNLSKGQFAEGGSTITQQLVKNYFLTSEKTLKRKIMEQILAVLLELRVDKDSILANYLNVIYMGQKGSFQVLGIAAASEHYFSKPLASLSLPECALLAAVINNPGRYSPIRAPEAALARRNLVLTRMEQLKMISADQFAQATKAPLRAREGQSLNEPAPYFVQAVLEHIKDYGLDADSGLKIYTTLSPRLQDYAQRELAQHLINLEKQYPKLIAPGQVVQGAAIVVDIPSGGVSAFVSGRDFRQSQYNRLTNSLRQPGSLFKPFVYLAALESGDFQPDTLIKDEPWTYKYEGQVWSPQNYDKKFRGDVTLKQALSQSLNVPTARMAIDVGIKSIIELARRLGIESPLVAVPSLSLGAAEVKPWEMAQAYLTIARHGERAPLHLVTSVTDANGDELYPEPEPLEQVVANGRVDELIEMMKETFRTGTAQWLGKMGLPDEPAGKTGTTSDTRDNWFVGFNDKRLTIIWVGFDNNAPTGLTGASAAAPLWYKIQYH